MNGCELDKLKHHHYANLRHVWKRHKTDWTSDFPMHGNMVTFLVELGLLRSAMIKGHLTRIRLTKRAEALIRDEWGASDER